uniref:Myb domain-containing protein n=1 Tax=Elaeophora elaphi TaxID=1147741 RepID=A0A0R3RMN1_9BILA
MQIVDDNCPKDERCRTTLLPSSSSSTSTNFYVPVTTLNMQPSRTIREPYIQCHDNENNNSNNNNNHNNNNNNGNDYDDNDENDNDNYDVNIEKRKMKQNTNGPFFGSTYHYLQIDRNSINILLKVAAAFVLLCIAGCLVLQHLRISRLDYRIRRIELNSAYSIQILTKNY